MTKRVRLVPPEQLESGACVGHPNPKLWFIDAAPDSASHEPAKRICREQCPVASVCLDYALAIEGDTRAVSRHGVWGGLNPAERARLAGLMVEQARMRQQMTDTHRARLAARVEAARRLPHEPRRQTA